MASVPKQPVHTVILSILDKSVICIKKKKSRDESEKSLFRDAGKAFVCTMNGRGEMQIENYGSLGDYDEGKIILHCHKCTMTIEGEKLQIAYFTDIDMRITGKIRSVHF